MGIVVWPCRQDGVGRGREELERLVWEFARVTGME